MMICLQVENKILPTIVVNQELKEKVKEIESTQHRKVSAKEKETIKNGIYSTFLPKAFTKKGKIFAYFDIKNNWLIIDTTSNPKIELFLNTLKKTFD
jgi:recombination associated protein RdgC